MTSLRNWVDTVLFGYRFVYDDSEEKPERNALHFVAPFAIADNASTKRTTVTMPEVSAAAAGLVPATDGAFKVLTADGAAAPVWTKVGNDNVADDADIECSKLDGEFDAVSISTDAGLTVGTTCAVTGAITAASCTATGNVGGATLTATTSASVGATPATAGAVRLANTATVQARNAGDDGNVEVVSVDGSDDIHVGATANSASSVYVDVATGEAFYVRVNGATALTVTAGKATVNTVDAANVTPTSGDLTLGVVAGQEISLEVDGGAGLEVDQAGIAIPFAHQDADITLTDTDLTTVATDLSVFLTVGKWMIETRLHVDPASTDGFRYDYATSGGLVIGNAEGFVMGSSITASFVASVARRTNMTADTSLGSSDEYVWLERTTLDVTTAGTLTVRAAKHADASTDTTLLEGSCLLAIRKI